MNPMRNPSFERFTVKKLITCATTVAALVLSGSAIGQTFTYDNEAQLIGAAVASPESTRLILVNVLKFCTSNFEAVTPAANAAFSGWIERHRTYLNHSAGYRSAAKSMLTRAC